ncbi:hypothetical protein FIU81_03555 [Palleronia sp. THAF1]|nr:hypothetical protein FIU81_03555 [Palleronia sp. THAF1]
MNRSIAANGNSVRMMGFKAKLRECLQSARAAGFLMSSEGLGSGPIDIRLGA